MSTLFFPRPGSAPTVSIFDSNQLTALRKGVTSGTPSEAEHAQVAQQFEALLLQQMLKQARQTASGNGMFNSESVQMAQSMGDEQLALNLATPGLGLAQVLMAQMQESQGVNALPSQRPQHEAATTRLPHLRSFVGEHTRLFDASSISALIKKLGAANSSIDKVVEAVSGAPAHISQFVTKMRSAVEAAAAETGIPAKLIMSQAALESGWGKREILHQDGSTSHNLFGIKASKNWKGKVAHIMTTEFVDGKMVKIKQPFRAYESYVDSLTDYASLISKNPRYESVLKVDSAEQAAREVQAAGYATDPNYASKLIAIMSYFDSGAAP